MDVVFPADLLALPSPATEGLATTLTRLKRTGIAAAKAATPRIGTTPASSAACVAARRSKSGESLTFAIRSSFPRWPHGLCELRGGSRVDRKSRPARFPQVRSSYQLRAAERGGGDLERSHRDYQVTTVRYCEEEKQSPPSPRIEQKVILIVTFGVLA